MIILLTRKTPTDMKTGKLLAGLLLVMLCIPPLTAQNPKRTVLYTLEPGETICYGEYMVDFASPNKNFVATIIKKKDAEDYGSGYIYYPSFSYRDQDGQWQTRSIPYDIILNGDRRNYDWNPSYVDKPEKTVSTKSWDYVTQVWKYGEGYYIRYDGLIYGPYDSEPWVDIARDAFLVCDKGDVYFIKDGKEIPLAEKGYTTMPFVRDDNRDYYKGHGSNFYTYERKDNMYELTVNGKTYEVENSPNYFSMSPNGQHWVLTGGKTIYVNGEKTDYEENIYYRGYIDNSGNYILHYNDGFILNGKTIDLPAGAVKIKGYNEYWYGMAILDDFSYRYKEENYVFDGKSFVKVVRPNNSKTVYHYSPYPGTIISGNRKHILHNNWENACVSVDGKRMGKAPAITAEWNDKTKSFFWNALEGRELVVYEYKPQ